MRHRIILIMFSVLFCVGGGPYLAQAAREPKKERGTMNEAARLEYRANSMTNQGMDLLKVKQEERGVKLLSDVPRLFPTSKARFRAQLLLGIFYLEKRNFKMAIAQFTAAQKSSDEDIIAEALYRMGICFYNMNQFDRAFVTLRKVTNEYPASIFANESYYYIGSCHFKLERWSRAVQALRKVGTSTSEMSDEIVYAEAEQRVFAKVSDDDLVVLADGPKTFPVDITAASGDSVEVMMQPLGKSLSTYIASVASELNEPNLEDDVLQIVGGDLVTITYTDTNTETGERNVKVLATLQMVSTASIGFTDGAYREYTNGIFADQDAFIRVRDLDGDVSPEPDQIAVMVRARYKPQTEVDIDKRGISLDEEIEWEYREPLEIILTETGNRTGIFVAATPLSMVGNSDRLSDDGEVILVGREDEVVLSYTDADHIGGSVARELSASAKVLTGRMQDVEITNNVVTDPELKARKNLVEAQLYLRLAQVFKDVGLESKAGLKADVGLDKVQQVVTVGLKAGLEQKIIEEAYNAKWDLLLAKGELEKAMLVCQELVQLFPDSALVDAAMMKIAVAKSESKFPEERADALNVFLAIIDLPKSSFKAEAQFRIATLIEESTLAKSRESGREVDSSRVMAAYKKVADNYPDSIYAGESLDKITRYYIKVGDYQRAISLMEVVFQDYPDASFLDGMLYKWALCAYRLRQPDVTIAKCDELLSDYPESKYSAKARKMQKAALRNKS